jgi:hypothetical protein
MKKIMILMGAVALFACNNNVKEEDKSTPPPAAAAPAQQTPPAAEGQKDGTIIKVGSDGVSVESKDGSKKSNVKVSKDSTSIEISRPK